MTRTHLTVTPPKSPLVSVFCAPLYCTSPLNQLTLGGGLVEDTSHVRVTEDSSSTSEGEARTVVDEALTVEDEM